VGLRAGLDVEAKEEIPAQDGNRIPIVQPVASLRKYCVIHIRWCDMFQNEICLTLGNKNRLIYKTVHRNGPCIILFLA